MTKFKAGDLIKISRRGSNWNHDGHMDYLIGTTQTVVRATSDRVIIRNNGARHSIPEWYLKPSEIELVTKGGDMPKPYQRKTYKLIKELPELKKGALLQEKCDDGTQDFKALDDDFVKYTNEHGKRVFEYPRQAVENEPSYFVEVFKVTPQYMTREELDQWEEFKLAQAKPRRAKRTIAKPPKAVKAKKPARATKAKAA